MRYLWIFVVLSAVSAFGQNAYGPDFLNLHCTAPDPFAQVLFNIPPRPGLVPDHAANGNVIIYCDAASNTLKVSFGGNSYVGIFSPVLSANNGLLISPSPAGNPVFSNLFNVTNPQAGGDPNDRRLFDFNCTTDSSTSNPNFSDENCIQIIINATKGQALFGGGTSAKKTFIPLNIAGNYQGSGQRFAEVRATNCYGGESDCADNQYTVTFTSVPISGDEGESVRTVSYLQQPGHLSISQVVSKTATTCNTTFTQSVTANVNVQTFTVASTTGCNVNDWVVLGQEVATGTPNESVMQITAVGVGTLSGQVLANYSNGATISPSTVLTTSGDGNGPWGEGRVLVNQTTTPYTTGTVSNISGAGFTGSGTTWTTGIVGGNSTVIGCIGLTNDQYVGNPFIGSAHTQFGPLNSWYRITGVSSNTALSILSFSTAADAAYHGKGVGAGGYQIAPCAKVLKISADSKTVYLETNTFTWNANDFIEEAIGSYPDLSGYQDIDAVYTTGGVLRRHLLIQNRGARQIVNAIEISQLLATGGNADTVGWGNGISISGAGTGQSIATSGTGDSISINGGAPPSANPAAIRFGPQATSTTAIQTDANGSLQFGTIFGNASKTITQGTTQGSLAFSTTDPITAASVTTGQYVGNFDVVNFNNADDPRFGLIGAGSSSNVWFIQTKTRSGSRELDFFNENNGSGNGVATTTVMTMNNPGGGGQGSIGINNTSPNQTAALDVGGFIKSQGTIQLTSDLTLAANTSLQTIFSWSGIRGFNAINFSFHCALTYSQATAAVSDAFGIQAATNSPTRIDASGMVFTAAGTPTTGNLQNLTTTTSTNILTFTPSAITTIFNAYLDGTLQLGANANTINIMASQSNSADLLTVKAGSYCALTN